MRAETRERFSVNRKLRWRMRTPPSVPCLSLKSTNREILASGRKQRGAAAPGWRALLHAAGEQEEIESRSVLVIYGVPESLLVACCIQDGSTNLVRFNDGTVEWSPGERIPMCPM